MKNFLVTILVGALLVAPAGAVVPVGTSKQTVTDQFGLPSKEDPVSPVSGEIWHSTTDANKIKYRVGSTTYVLATEGFLSAGYQPLDATLTSFAALTIASGKIVYGTGADTFATVDSTSYGRAVLNLADAAAARTYFGTVIGTDVQAYDADLATWSGITPGTGVATALAANANATGGVVTVDGTATLTGKTLTAPTINGGTHSAITSLGIRSTGSGAYDLTFANTENLTAARTLTITTGDAARTITLSGNPTLGDWFDQSVKTTASPTFNAPIVTSLSLGATTPGIISGSNGAINIDGAGTNQDIRLAPSGTGSVYLNKNSSVSAAWFPGMVLTAGDSTNSGYQTDVYNAQARYDARRANGTKASPTALSTNDAILTIGVRGHDGAAYRGTNAAIIFSASENWTNTAGTATTSGSKIGMFVVPAGQTASVTGLDFGNANMLNVGSSSTWAAWGLRGVTSNFAGSSYTDRTSTGTVSTTTVFNSFTSPTLLAPLTAVYNNLANVYISGGVTLGSGATLGSGDNYGLWNVGKTRLDGAVKLGAGSSTALGRAPATLYQSITAVGNITTGVDDLITQTIAASTLATDGDRLRITSVVSLAANANSKQILAKYGSTTAYDSTAQVANAGTLVIEVVVTRTGAATQNVSARVNSSNALFASTANFTTAAETLSGSVTFKLTGEGVSTDDIIQRSLLIEYLPAP